MFVESERCRPEEEFMNGSSDTRRLFKMSVQQGRSERRPEEVHTALRVGRSPFQWVLANGKSPPVFRPPRDLLLSVEGLNDARTKLADFFNSLLDGFLNFAATQTACADPNAFWLPIDQRPNWLEVRLEDPLGFVIGVTDVMAGLATLAADITCKCHGCTPSSSRIDSRLSTRKPITGPLVLTSRFDGDKAA